MRHGIIALLVCTTLVARAADKPANEAARQHYDEGTKAYNLGEFARAADEYKQAYKLIGDPVILYNIAQAYRLANDFAQAIFFYRSYLRTAPALKNRADVEGRIATLEEQLAKQRSVATAPPNEVVAPHSTPPASKPPSEPPRPTEPAHVAESPPPPPPTAPTPAEAAQAVTPAPAVATNEVHAQPARTPIYKKWWLWTAVGVVVVGAAVGAGLAVGLSGTNPPPASGLGAIHVF